MPFAKSPEDHQIFQKNQGTDVQQIGVRRVNEGKKGLAICLTSGKEKST